MQTLTELIDLNRILLNLARSKEFPYGSPRHGYDFIAPLDHEGHIDPILWKKYRDYCRVRRFWAGEEDEVGRLVHKPGGAEHARWVFDYNHPDEDDDDEAGYKFNSVSTLFCRASTSPSAERTASYSRFLLSQSSRCCCRRNWSTLSSWKSRCDRRLLSTRDRVAAAGCQTARSLNQRSGSSLRAVRR